MDWLSAWLPVLAVMLILVAMAGLGRFLQRLIAQQVRAEKARAPRRKEIQTIIDASVSGPSDIRLPEGSPLEERVAALFRRLGAEVEIAPEDGEPGVDMVVTHLGQRLGLQLKSTSYPVLSRRTSGRELLDRDNLMDVEISNGTITLFAYSGREVDGQTVIDAKALRAWEEQGILPKPLSKLFAPLDVLNEPDQGRVDESSLPDPSSPTRALLARAVTQERVGHHAACIALCDQAIKGGELNAYAYNTRAIARERSGDLSGACNDYGRAIGCDPERDVLYYNRGKLLLALGRPEEALADLQRADELEPDVAKTVSSLGSALARLGRYREAIAAYDRALDLDPTRVEALSKRDWAQAMLEEGN